MTGIYPKRNGYRVCWRDSHGRQKQATAQSLSEAVELRTRMLAERDPGHQCLTCGKSLAGRRLDARHCDWRCLAKAHGGSCATCGRPITQGAVVRCMTCEGARRAVWDSDSAVAALRDWSRRHDDRTPTSAEWYGCGLPSREVLVRLFGSFKDGLAAAGLDPNPPGAHALGSLRSGKMLRNRQMVTGRSQGDWMPGTIKHFGAV